MLLGRMSQNWTALLKVMVFTDKEMWVGGFLHRGAFSAFQPVIS